MCCWHWMCSKSQPLDFQCATILSLILPLLQRPSYISTRCCLTGNPSPSALWQITGWCFFFVGNGGDQSLIPSSFPFCWSYRCVICPHRCVICPEPCPWSLQGVTRCRVGLAQLNKCEICDSDHYHLSLWKIVALYWSHATRMRAPAASARTSKSHKNI